MSPEGAAPRRESDPDDALRGRSRPVSKKADDFDAVPSAHGRTQGDGAPPSGQTVGPKTAAEDGGVELNFADEGPGEKSGDVIGRYRLVEEIGRGGFGSVWAADQSEPVRRRVALKIIKLGMDTRQVVARFEQERQALALMDHPGIARVLDAGATEAGRPYFVMDLVSGVPINEYCDRRDLAIDRRLEIFADVCAAVQHAHAKGVVHRDLKPSNILVGDRDGRPHATVIDFGVAKATAGKLGDRTLQTAPQQIVGTLHYMSPEQIAGSADIDTRSDVYSLGVVLYELLTGGTPFDPKSTEDHFGVELARLIREVEPAPPSSRVSASQAALPALAARRGVEPKKLGASLRGDLDWIVLKALEKDRTRRYETASGFASDVRRHLRGEPVAAVPPSRAYRIRKFVRRHRGAVAAASAVAASLVVGVVAFAWQAGVAEDERDAARRSATAEADARRAAQTLRAAESELRAKAEEGERKAAAINDFLVEMLGAADLRDLGREAKVAQVLDRASERVGAAFADRPAIEAAIRRILGKTYLSLGLLDKAEPHVAEAVELTREIYGAASAEVARTALERGALATQRGRDAEAAATLKEALDVATALEARDETLVLALRGDYANAISRLGRRAEAEEIFRANLAALRRRPPSRDLQIGLNSLGVLLHNEKRLDEAAAAYREAVDVGSAFLGPEHPDTLTARLNLGSVLNSKGAFAEAEPILRDATAALARVCGPDHPKTASAAGTFAEFLATRGRFREARTYYETALAGKIKAEGEASEAVADARQAYGRALKTLGETAAAIEAHRKAADAKIALFGRTSRAAIDARLDLANALSAARRVDEAEAMFKDLLDEVPRALGDDDALTIIATNSYGVLLLGQDRFADAEPFLRKALDVGRRTQGPDHRNTIVTQHNLTFVARELGRLDEAEALGKDAVERFVRVYGPRHANVATIRSAYGETLMRLGRTDDAEEEFVAATDIFKETMGADNPAVVAPATLLGTLRIDDGRPGEAEAVLREAAEIGARARGPEDRRTLRTRMELGRCLALLGRFGDAETILVAAQENLAKLAATGVDKDALRAARRLADLYAAWDAAAPDPTRAAKAAAWARRAAGEP